MPRDYESVSIVPNPAFVMWLCRRAKIASRSPEFGRALLVKGHEALAEIIRLAQPAVAMTFELDGDGERRIFGIVE